MKLMLLLPADYANVTGDGKLNVMGIFNQINATTFPARHPSMHLVIKLAIDLGEYGQTRQMLVKLLEPDGTEVMSISGEIRTPEMVAGIRPEVNAILHLKDIVFPKPGPYQFIVLIDKDFKGDATIYINQIQNISNK